MTNSSEKMLNMLLLLHLSRRRIKIPNWKNTVLTLSLRTLVLLGKVA